MLIISKSVEIALLMIVTSLNLYKLFLPQMIRIDPRGLVTQDRFT